MKGSREKKEFRTFKFKVDKTDSSDGIGIIEGYASTFGNVDFGDDVVDHGAFTKTINDKKGRFPILLDHDPSKQVGWNLEASEDAYGLRVKGELQLVTDEAKNRYLLAKRAAELGTQMGMSIGYTTIKWEMDSKDNNIRHLKEVALWEYSLVTFPMNDLAGVTAAKARDILSLFAQLQSGGYDLHKLEKALAQLGVTERQAQAAAEEIDPGLSQSVDTLIQKLRASQ